MSVRLWAYSPSKCDGDWCANDCDRCYKANLDTELEVEADGFITRPQQLELTSKDKAIPATDCRYPDCEECAEYRGRYCTVPMVVSKQIWHLTEALIVSMEKRLTELERLVTDEIIGSKERRSMSNTDPANLTWEDYLGENK